MADTQALSIRSEMGLQARRGGLSLLPSNMAEVVEVAKLMSTSGPAIPKHLRDNPGACMSVAMRAVEWGMNPWAVASKTYVVGEGIVSYEAQVISAAIITCAPIKRRPRYAYEGDGETRVCIVSVETLDGDVIEHRSPVFAKILPKNSPLWKTDPDMQLGYYTIRAMARRHFPDVILGVYDRDEAIEMVPSRPDRPRTFDQLKARAEDAEVEDLKSAAQDETIDPETGELADPNVDPPSPDEVETVEIDLGPGEEEEPGPSLGLWQSFKTELDAADDWHQIELATLELWKSPGFKAMPAPMQEGFRLASFARLSELVKAGYSFDFLDSVVAWRCYLAWEKDLATAKFNRNLFTQGEPWKKLETPQKIALDRAWDAMASRLTPPADAPRDADLS